MLGWALDRPQKLKTPLNKTFKKSLKPLLKIIALKKRHL